jgi:glycosyltransferase involved in cell wall biosynthesis
MNNPNPVKGLDLALRIAALCPDIPFCFVESWTLTPEARADLLQRLASLPNAELKPRTNDMKAVFGAARVVLIPSQWDEAWGRVASEAHVSGIPVLASDAGGLPEAVGPGGIVLDRHAPPERWAAALRELWTDQDAYDRLSRAALSYAERPELRIGYQTERFLGVLRQALGGG